MRGGLALATVVVTLSILAIAAPAGAASAGSAAGAPSVVTRYAPFVYLARDERFQPMDAGSFVSASSLSWTHDQNCPDDTAAARTKIDQARLGSGGYRHQIANALCIDHGAQHRSNELTRPRQTGKGGVPEREGFFLNFPNSQRAGEGPTAPVYYEYSPRRYVTYWFFYAFNDAPRPTNIFDHEGDWERISVQLNENNRAVRVAYYQHEGYCTIPWPDAGKHDGHPLAYSAQGTHATYPRVGSFPIARGLASDTTSRGAGWATYHLLANARTQGWFGFGGAWGEVGDGPNSTGPLGPSRFKGAVPDDWSRTCS